MKNKDGLDILTFICAVIIIGVIVYVVYLFVGSNNKLNINEVKNIKTEISSKQIDDNTVNIEKEIIYEEVEIASFTSTLYDNEENRVYNITKACESLNDTIIDPGNEFSFNDTIGPMGEENGYLKATGFDSQGKLIQVSAGGMCQVSSTLYNVALLANLEITERHPHSRRVYYVPADKDATVYYGSLDLKFINNTGEKIKITASNDNYSVTIKMYKLKQSN